MFEFVSVDNKRCRSTFLREMGSSAYPIWFVKTPKIFPLWRMVVVSMSLWYSWRPNCFCHFLPFSFLKLVVQNRVLKFQGHPDSVGRYKIELTKKVCSTNIMSSLQVSNLLFCRIQDQVAEFLRWIKQYTITMQIKDLGLSVSSARLNFKFKPLGMMLSLWQRLRKV